jgi:predicted RNase H-like nuclease (RuvC/YqgF family)
MKQTIVSFWRQNSMNGVTSMSTKDEIKNAVAAHGRWKTKLKSALDTGKMDAHLSIIKADNECTFGKWLNGPTITEKQKHSDHYREVRKLHSAFHEKASKVAQLAVSGNKADAMKMLEVNGEFSIASAALTTAMLAWLKKAT